MFDTYTKNNLNINAISGTLVKNYDKSFFITFSKNSVMEDIVFSTNPRLKTGEYEYERIVVLQTMLLPENGYLCEIMWQSDFDEMFRLKGEQNDFAEADGLDFS